MAKENDQIDKDFMKAMKFAKDDMLSSDFKIDRVTTGIPQFDLSIGGGLPKGKIIEFYGTESSGKTTLALKAASKVISSGDKVVFLDVEQSIDLDWASKMVGINLIDEMKKKPDDRRFIIIQPTTLEKALDYVNMFAQVPSVGMIIYDSVASSVPLVDMEKTAEDSPKIGAVALAMSNNLKKLISIVNKTNTIVIFINQVRANIGSMIGGKTTPGGVALKFYSSIRIEIARVGWIKDSSKDENTGAKTLVTVRKNKTYPPMKKATFIIDFSRGLSEIDNLIDFASLIGIITKSGSWFSYKDLKVQGSSKLAIEILKDNSIVESLYNECYSSVNEIVNKNKTPADNDSAYSEDTDDEDNDGDVSDEE